LVEWLFAGFFGWLGVVFVEGFWVFGLWVV